MSAPGACRRWPRRSRRRPALTALTALTSLTSLTLLSGCGTAARVPPAPQPAVAGSTANRPAPRPDCTRFTCDQGGITRGARDAKRLALIFTGGSFAEGAGEILDALRARGVKASFFVTGDFIRTPAFRPHLERMVREGHYLGPHSDAHLLYAPWEDRSRTLVTEAQFRDDLERNLADLAAFGRTREQLRYFIPPYEWYNEQIAEWATSLGLVLFNYTPGTRSHADYMLDGDPRFLSSQRIYDSILEYEAAHPDGLNGFLLLLHLGAGPERTDKMHRYVAPLIDELRRRGYTFQRVDELLEPR